MLQTSLYLDLVRTLYKAEGKLVPTRLMRGIHATLNAHDGPMLKATQGILKRACTRFRRKVSVDKLTELFSVVHKSDSDDVKAQLKVILDSCFAGATTDFIAVEQELITELSAQFATAYDVQLNFRLVNQKAVDYLTAHADNYFSTLSDAQAEGLLKQAGAVLASEDGYTIRDVAKTIRNAFLNTALYYPTDTRAIGSADWALTTARTEVARSASFAQKATLESIGLQTWQWCAEDSACDICSENDQEIVAIGDNFPSGDSEPPAHANCLLPGTSISTRRGLIPIEDIRVGDEVLTHLGRYRRVLALSRQQICEDILEIRVGETSISVTGNHPIYHRYGWSRADALQVGDEVGTMQPEPMLSFPGKTN
jgi:hypothetical protein